MVGYRGADGLHGRRGPAGVPGVYGPPGPYGAPGIPGKVANLVHAVEIMCTVYVNACSYVFVLITSS